MKNFYRFFYICLIITAFASIGFAQRGLYPQNAESLIALVNHILKTNFSTDETIKRLGTISKDEDESEEPDNTLISIKPFPANGKNIEELMISTEDDPKKLGEIEFIFVNPVKISIGTLQKQYGKPQLLPSPIVNCQEPNCNRRLFSGYFFVHQAIVSGKKEKIRIMVFTKPTANFPKNAAVSILEADRIRISREIDY